MNVYGQEYREIESKLDWSLLFNIKDTHTEPKDDNWIVAMEEGSNGEVVCAGFHKQINGAHRFPAWFVVSPDGEIVKHEWLDFGLPWMINGSYDDIVDGKDAYYIAGGGTFDHKQWDGEDDPLVRSFRATGFITVLDKTTYETKTYLLDDLDASGLFGSTITDRPFGIDVYQNSSGEDEFIVVGGQARDRGSVLVYNMDFELQAHFFIQKHDPNNSSLSDRVNDVEIVPAASSENVFDIVYTGEQHKSTTACEVGEPGSDCSTLYPEYTFENMVGNPLPNGTKVSKDDKDIIVGRLSFSLTNGLQEYSNFPKTFNYYNKLNPGDPSTLSVNPGKTFASEYGPNTPGETGRFQGPFCHESPVMNTFFDNTSYDLGRRLKVIGDEMYVIAWTNKFTEVNDKYHSDNGGRENCGGYEHYYDAEAFVLRLDINTGAAIGVKHVAHFSGGDFRSPIEVDQCGNIIVAGTTADENFSDGGMQDAGGNRMFLVKMDRDLNVLWRKHFFQYGMGNCLFDAVPAADGGYYAGGNHTEMVDDGNGGLKEKESYIVIHLGPDQVDIPWKIDRQYSEEVISGTQTWSSDRNIRAKVVVPSGSHLTIRNCTVRFAAGRYSRDMSDRTHMGIIVEPGGRLTLDNALLKGIADCSGDKMWDGIRVEGNPEIPHQPVNGQGQVVSINSTIENAYIAINVSHGWEAIREVTEDDGITDGIRRWRWPTATSQNTGGKVYLTNTIFRNCYRSIIFMKYNQYANSSFINNCQFINDQPLADPISFTKVSLDHPDGIHRGALTHLTIWANQGIQINNSRFTGLASLPQSYRANGIGSYDARYRVIQNSNSNTANFKDLQFGVLASGVFGGVENSVAVENCAFDGVSQSIILRNTVADRIRGNHIANIPIPEPAGSQNYGIFGEGNQFSHIVENDLDGINHLNVRGIVQRNGLQAINDIYLNVFNNFYFSTQIEQDNAGLDARCNEYSSVHRSAWNVIGNGNGALGPQGESGIFTGVQKADNQFFDQCNGDPLGKDPDIEADFAFDYYDKAGNPNPAETDCVDPVVNFDGGSSVTGAINCKPFAGLCQDCDITEIWRGYKHSLQGNSDLGDLLRSSLYRYDKAYKDADDLVELDMIEEVLLDRGDNLSQSYLASLYANRGDISASDAHLQQIQPSSFHSEDFKSVLPFIQSHWSASLSEAETDELLLMGSQGLDQRSSASSRLQALSQLTTGRFSPPRFLENTPVSRYEADNKEEEGMEQSYRKWSIAPNPATDELRITLADKRVPGTLHLYNAQGVLLRTETISSSTVYIDVSQLAPGIYYVRAEQDGALYGQKLIIQ